MLNASKRLGEKAYCPVDTVARVHRRDPTKTRRIYQKPLFVGYMFVSPELSQWQELQWFLTLGPAYDGYLMHFDDKHLSVEDREIERIKRIEERIKSETEANIKPVFKTFRPGQMTQIFKGVLSGAMARVVNTYGRRVDVEVGNKRVIVDVTMLR